MDITGGQTEREKSNRMGYRKCYTSLCHYGVVIQNGWQQYFDSIYLLRNVTSKRKILHCIVFIVCN